MERSTREALASAAAIVVAGAVVVTCAANRQAEPPAIPTASMAASAVASASAPASAAASALPPEAPEAPPSTMVLASATPRAPLAPTGTLALPRFYAALADLARGTRNDHVRITWLGDSHTAADLWTHPVRRALQSRFGNGGPGFVRLGWDEKRYRHEGLKVEALLSFNTAPVPYAKVKREDDGVFGLGGARLSPVEADARAAVEITDGKLAAEELRWDIAYRVADGDSLVAHAGTEDASLPAPTDAPSEAAVRHHTLTTKSAPARLELGRFRGHPQLFGATIESARPGVVLDTIGLNGARVATFLAWEETSWQAELGRRKADVTVLAFGTNESSDQPKSPEKYRAQTESLLARARAASPDGECLVILPMDRSGADHERALATIARGMSEAARAAGCATWSAFDAMGGAGSMDAWSHESPPRSGADGVHLTAKGYGYLGEKLAEALLSGAPAGARASR